MDHVFVHGRLARIGPGVVLKLSEEQIRRRFNRLKKVEGGHEPTEPLDFKNGEQFHIVSGRIPKVLLADITVTSVTAQTAAAAVKAAEPEPSRTPMPPPAPPAPAPAPAPTPPPTPAPSHYTAHSPSVHQQRAKVITK